MIESRFVRNTLFLISVGVIVGTSAFPSIVTSRVVDVSYEHHVIDINDAARVAQAKLSELHRADCSIDYCFVKNRLDSTPLYYVFDLHPQGYLVVSGSYNLPPVIAYSFTSSFPDPGISNPLSDMLTRDLTFRLQCIAYLPESLLQDRHRQWDFYMRGQSLNRDRFEQWPPEGTTPTGGWLITRWTQGAPYNSLCPLDLAHGGARSVAGCPAVAMAQILNYHNTTRNISFNDIDDYYHNFAGNQYWIDNDYVTYGFPSFPQLNTYLSSLENHYNTHVPPTNTEKAALSFACGVAAHQVYSASVSGTYGVNQAYHAYQRFNCTTAALLPGNNTNIYGRLAHDMMDAIPAHLAVVDPSWQSGHNLVVDGYNTNNYYHLNFGWGGSYDGWYLIPNEIPYGLTVFEGVIVDILQSNTGTPDLLCNGTLAWMNITPGNTATGSFTVRNTGTAGSDLAWRITEWPIWGTWSFTPSYGHHLTPEAGPTTIQVSVIAPNQQNQQYTGVVKIVNIDNNADYQLIPVSLHTSSGIKADLSCSGSLTWNKVRPGSLLSGDFTIRNVGGAHSNLSWEIASWPAWGNWTFVPSHGDHLTPEHGPLTINVSVIAPNNKHKTFDGQVKIVNTENSSDYEIVPVALTTPYKPDFFLLDLLELLLERFPHAFPLLRFLFNL